MIELQRSPSHQALASDGSNAHQSTRQGAGRMLGNTILSLRSHRKEGVEKPPSRVFVFWRFCFSAPENSATAGPHVGVVPPVRNSSSVSARDCIIRERSGKCCAKLYAVRTALRSPWASSRSIESPFQPCKLSSVAGNDPWGKRANENGIPTAAPRRPTQPRAVIGFVSASGAARRSIFVLTLPTASAPRMSQRFARVRCHRRLSIDR